MLSNDVPATPRARPPAQARRSVFMQVKQSPPPPYVAASALKLRTAPLDTLPASPIGTPLRDEGVNSSQMPFDIEEPSWMKERSREELSDLLTKAENIIRERENELSTTSAICKSLYEDSVTWKSKHRALLAGIPATPSVGFPSGPSTPQSRHASLSADNFLETPSPSPRPLLAMRHSRKISVSPSDIALLSDQNAELMQKLEKLELESRQADQSGRRALKRLEKEIKMLREELDATQARSEELEEKTRQSFGKGVENAVEQALKKKQDAVAKIRALRGKGEDASNGEDGECDVRDFAPPRSASLPRSPQKRRGGEERNPQSADILAPPSVIHDPTPPRHQLECGFSSDVCRNEDQKFLPYESALISQLLSKIEELERTNAQIKQQQVETTTKLWSVQRDAEKIGKLYDCLGDPENLEWEVVVDDNRGQEQGPADDNTIRFRSLRRTLEDGATKLSDITGEADGGDTFNPGLSVENFSTAYGSLPLNANPFKQRKSVVGLFDSGPVHDMSSKQSVFHYGGYIDADADNTQRTWSVGTNSPALSILNMSATPLHTLGSELGSEFGDEWGANAGNHHLRATSISNLMDLDIERRSPSPMPATTSTPCHVQDHSDSGTVMQVTLQEPTPERIRTTRPDVECTSNRRRMSHTLHSRTSRWVEGRLKNTLLGSGDPSPALPEDTNKARVSEDIFISAEATVGTFAGQDPSKPALQAPEVDTTLARKSSGAPTGVHVDRKPKSAVSFLLEAWLWLQFAMIILVFLWAMAKRGPKAVIEDAERRRLRNGQ